jgi:hypothetical protein
MTGGACPLSRRRLLLLRHTHADHALPALDMTGVEVRQGVATGNSAGSAGQLVRSS